MLGDVFDRFIEKAPVAVMVRGVLERVLNPDALQALYERAAVTQYTRELMFSSLVGLMNLVVCRIQPSIHAAYQDHKEEIETSLTSVYNKLNGIDTQTSRALVRDTARAIASTNANIRWLGVLVNQRRSVADEPPLLDKLRRGIQDAVGTSHLMRPPHGFRCAQDADRAVFDS